MYALGVHDKYTLESAQLTQFLRLFYWDTSIRHRTGTSFVLLAEYYKSYWLKVRTLKIWKYLEERNKILKKRKSFIYIVSEYYIITCWTRNWYCFCFLPGRKLTFQLMRRIEHWHYMPCLSVINAVAFIL